MSAPIVTPDTKFDDTSDESVLDDFLEVVEDAAIAIVGADEVEGAAERDEYRDQFKDLPDEEPGTIDDAITQTDMLEYLRAEIRRKGIAGHHIESMNSFNSVGIRQIAMDVFTVENRIKNVRDKTDEDREITEIIYKVEFTDVQLSPPSWNKYMSGQPQSLAPNAARLNRLTYSAKMSISAKITATAVYRNGTTKKREAVLENHRIASVPCQVGTELCHTWGASRETKKLLEEDPNDHGGYFIIKGVEWTVDNLENIAYNSIHVFRNMHETEIARATFLSKPGDAFENSYQVILRYHTNGSITIEITTNKFDKFTIPFYLIFRMLGMTRDKEIIDHIVYGVDNKDEITMSLLPILERAFDVPDPKFEPVRRSTDPAEIISFIAQHTSDGNSNAAAAARDDNIARYLNSNIMNTIDRYIFPHIGTGVEHRIRKLRFFGHLINRLLCVTLGIVEPTDRDSYKSKRVFAAGTSMAKSFKTAFNFAIVQEIKNRYNADFKAVPFSSVNLVESMKAAINNDNLERMLMQSITTGNKTIKVKQTEITNRVSSQMLYHKNDLNVTSTLNTIQTPNTSASKQNERADEMRRVHPTYTGYIDVSQSADTGEKVGMVKQMACTASVCGASSSAVLKNILRSDPDLIDLDDIAPNDITARKLAKVFVNGDWIGCCEKSFELVEKYRKARRFELIHPFTTIVWEPLVREVYFWTDVGRLVRPLIIVYSNIKEYKAARRAGKPIKFQQWIKLTKKHLLGLRNGTVTMDDLRRERVIEYISPEEQESARLAMDIDELRQNQNDVCTQYTHCDIRQAIFGIVTLASPLGNHSNAVRNTMYTNHRKQSAGWYSLAYPYRVDKGVTLQHYCERPLVSTFSDAFTYPNGQNTIVALMLHGGTNQEDSLQINGSSVARGLFNASYYNYEKTDLEKNEQFGIVDPARTMNMRRDATYEHLENGFIKPGTIAQRGQVMIAKVHKIPKPTNDFHYIDRSVVFKRDYPVVVERVIESRNADGEITATVKWRANRPIAVGDKCSSRTGNKGIVSDIVPAVDMPYTEDGLVPDILVNAHSIPTRMAVNQPIECLLGILAAIKGTHIDATMFMQHSIDAVIEELKKHNVKYKGHTRMYNGRTGEYLDTLIFIGPTTYQRLQKFVIDEHYATRGGPTSALTKQPLDGKNNDGGLRLGEMEKDTIVAHGTMRALYAKFNNDSDGLMIPVCRCGQRAVYNAAKNIYKCKHCGDNADIAKVPSSWVSNLMLSEFSAMNIKPTLVLEPHTFPRHQV